MNVPLLDLKAQYRGIKAEILSVMEAVCEEPVNEFCRLADLFVLFTAQLVRLPRHFQKPAVNRRTRGLVPRIRPRGLLLADNTLSHGRVVDPDNTSASVQGIRDFNSLLVSDERVNQVLLPIGDGLTLARKN